LVVYAFSLVYLYLTNYYKFKLVHIVWISKAFIFDQSPYFFVLNRLNLLYLLVQIALPKWDLCLFSFICFALSSGNNFSHPVCGYIVMELDVFITLFWSVQFWIQSSSGDIELRSVQSVSSIAHLYFQVSCLNFYCYASIYACEIRVSHVIQISSYCWYLKQLVYSVGKSVFITNHILQLSSLNSLTAAQLSIGSVKHLSWSIVKTYLSGWQLLTSRQFQRNYLNCLCLIL
jgi:hypothetical protein